MLEIVESNQENWRDTPKDWILKWLHFAMEAIHLVAKQQVAKQ
jgi:hypothetical protein